MTEHEWEFLSSSPQATLELGSRMAECLEGDTVMGLIGPLGAGKTLLVKGIAAELCAGRCEVTSPTFTLIQEYSGRLTIYHLDMYRLERRDDPLLMQLDELIRPDSVVMVEWADRVGAALPADTLWVHIKPNGESGRRFLFRATGANSLATLQRLRSRYV